MVVLVAAPPRRAIGAPAEANKVPVIAAAWSLYLSIIIIFPCRVRLCLLPQGRPDLLLQRQGPNLRYPALHEATPKGKQVRKSGPSRWRFGRKRRQPYERGKKRASASIASASSSGRPAAASHC